MKIWNFFTLLTIFCSGLGFAADSNEKGDVRDPENRPIMLENVRTTAYTHSESDHLKYGRKNAIGTRLQYTGDYTSAASDWSHLPVGTKFKIEGIDKIFIIDDYGSALVGRETVDLYYPTRRGMNNWGLRHVDIEILEFGDYEKSREILTERRGWRHCRKMLASINSLPALPPPGVPMKINSAAPETMMANVTEKAKIESTDVTPEPQIFLANVEPDPEPKTEMIAPPAPKIAVTPGPQIELASYVPVRRVVRPLSLEEIQNRSAARQTAPTPVEVLNSAPAPESSGTVVYRKRSFVPITPTDA